MCAGQESVGTDATALRQLDGGGRFEFLFDPLHALMSIHRRKRQEHAHTVMAQKVTAYTAMAHVAMA